MGFCLAAVELLAFLELAVVDFFLVANDFLVVDLVFGAVFFAVFFAIFGAAFFVVFLVVFFAIFGVVFLMSRLAKNMSVGHGDEIKYLETYYESLT